MAKLGYFDSVLSDAGRPILATVTVYEAGTTTKASLWADAGGTIVKDNPFQTDALGRFQFYAAAGKYDIEVSGNGITTYKIQNVDLADVTKSTELTDMPQTLGVGNAHKIPRVNETGTAYELVTSTTIPSGVIVMWSGAIATIPSGWLLCDGDNDTPDLRDRFIVGARQDDGGVAKTNVTGSLTQSGGAATHLHSDHTISPHAGTAVASHPAWTHASAGEHTHDNHLTQQNTSIGGTADRLRAPSTHAPDGGHTHDEHPARDHVVTQPSNHSDLTHSSASNLGPYYALAFIIKE